MNSNLIARRATPACTAGVCQQGQKACPCPAACELPEDDIAMDSRVETIVIVAVCVVALVAAIAPALV